MPSRMAAAPPGLAALIDASARGDAQAMSVLANMAEQMMKAGATWRCWAGACAASSTASATPTSWLPHGPLGRELLISLLDELAKLRPQ